MGLDDIWMLQVGIARDSGLYGWERKGLGYGRLEYKCMLIQNSRQNTHTTQPTSRRRRKASVAAVWKSLVRGLHYTYHWQLS
jgi:hypothetical protein